MDKFNLDSNLTVKTLEGKVFRYTPVSLVFIMAMLTSLIAIPFQMAKVSALGGEESSISDISPGIVVASFTTNSSTTNTNITPQNTTQASSLTTNQSDIPEAAIGPVIPPEKGYLVEEIGGGLYWVTDGSYNVMFMVTDEGVVAIDAPPSIADNYLKAIAEVTDRPIRYVIYSHSHLDHIGAAASIFPDNATYIAHEKVAEELQRAHEELQQASTAADNNNNSQSPPMQLPPIPTQTFAQNYTLQAGNQTLELNYHGNNHEEGNIFIYAPAQRALMLVDVIFPGWVPFVYLALAEDVFGYVQAHDIVLNNYDFDTFVGGHLTRLGTREDIQIQREFITDLINASSRANQNVTFAEIIQRVGPTNNVWALFDTYLDTIVEQCVNEMLPKWQDRLGGAEAFMSTHCQAMTSSLRVDPTSNTLQQTTTTSAE
jgi:glyoxylase-like metal-dependent hydrolase (beta-lactamase superfamily II)